MRFQSASHPFWGVHAPLAALSGGSLLVLASARFSHALICGFALLWVHGLTSLALGILPRQGKEGMFLASFAAALFTLILSLLSPILALDSLLFLVLCPLCCVSSGALERAEKLDLGEGVFQSLTEGACLAVLILALALIREPLGYGTLSIPGGPQGIFCPVRFPRESYLPARIIAASAGAFFLLGYGIALFRRFGGNLAAPSPAAREGRTKG